MERVSKILDWRGNPIKVQQLQEEQTSRIGFIGREFENHPTRGLTPARLAGILQNAEGGDLVEQMDLYEDMEEKDAHIFTELSKRKRVLQGLDWRIVPPRNPNAAEEKQADQLQEWFEDLDNFEDVIFDLADGIGKGYSNIEIIWEMAQGYRLPALAHRPARWFTVDEDDRNKLLLRTDTGNGEPLWPMGWISHVHKAKTGYISRAGLHRVLAWPYLFKTFSIRDLAEFLEIYGIPVRIGTYPSGASDNEKATLLRAVTSIGHNAAGIMPEGMMMEFKEAAKGASDPFQAMIAWCESSQSKAILGGTLTTSAQNTGLGSNLGDVHNEVRKDLRDSDARQIASTLTRDLVWPMLALNIVGADPRRSPRFEFDIQEPEDIKLMSDALPKLVGIGMRIPVSWAHDKLQIPQADEEEAVLGSKTAPPPPPEEPGQAAAKAALKSTPEPDATDKATGQLQAQTDPLITGALDKVRALLDEVDSLEELQDRLVDAYNYLDIDELSQVIQLGMAAADLAGRFDVQEGA
jgi:phage gp29-like protein